MKLFLSSFLLIISCSSIAQLKYPATKKTDVADDYFGTKVVDPYRWLEDDKSAETAKWVQEQNAVTNDYLSKIPFREDVRTRLTKLWNFPKSSAPFRGGKHYFVYTNDGLQNQYVLNIMDSKAGAPVPFLDPNKLSADGTVNIEHISVSNDGKNLAYSIARGGSDWNEIYVMNIENGKQYKDKLQWVKFSGISWRGKGFYYSGYDAPDSSSILKGKNEFQKVYYHVVGTEQKSDIIVHEDKDHPDRRYGIGVTEDERFLILTGMAGGQGNDIAIKDLKAGKGIWNQPVNDFNNKYNVVDNDSTMFFITTNKNAPKYKLTAYDMKHPEKGFMNLIPENNEVMQEVASAANKYFVVKYMKDASSSLKVFDRKGKFLYNIPLTALGTVDELHTSNKDDKVFYSLTTFTAPPTVYVFNLTTRKQEVYFQPKLDFRSDNYETKQVFYPSKDGTIIPMFLVYKKGLQLNGTNPTLLFGYGGFNISKTPEFKIERLMFLEQGGVFAMPNLRGGGEYGEAWHEAGIKEKKQNVFDDFIAAAEYLIKEKYTSPEKLAIGGRSNGGLLVGAVMTQRPELFKVAIPTVGVMDMLRFHKFTIGWAWKSDYGSSETREGFNYLYKYSPLHTIKEVINYPATLATTGDHDDRVVPAHSYKFISTLQDKNKGNNPILIRVDINAGHAGATVLGSSKPVSKQIEEQTDISSFIMYNLGMNWKQ